MKPFIRHLFALSLAAILISLSSCGHGHKEPDRTELSAMEVDTAMVGEKEVPVFEEVVGTVRPKKEADVTAKVTGRLLTMNAVPGMRVKEGEVLAKLDVGELEAALERAEAGLAQAERDAARLQKLRESNAVSEADFEQAESRRQMAAASVRETKIMVENAVVEAPFDGTVTRKYLEPGDLASPERAIFTMEDSSLLQLEIGVAESLVGGINLGDEFRVEISGADAELEGKVSEMSPSADVGSRTFSVKLDLPKNDALRAGQFGRAFIPRGTRMALVVPDSAVISRGQMDYVFVVSDNTARLRIVRTGNAQSGETEILAGLDSGETVIPNPPSALQDGQQVTDGAPILP